MGTVSHNRIPLRLLHVVGMGPPLNYYPGETILSRHWRWAGFLLVLCGGICIAWAWVGLIKRWLNFGLAAIPGENWLPLVLGGMLVLGGLLWVGVGFLCKEQVYLTFHGGLACSRRRRILAWRWEDFTSLKIDSSDRRLRGMAGSQRLRLELESRNGNTLRIGPKVKGIESLRDEIRSRINPHLTAEARSALGRGEIVRFGPLAVHETQGIGFRGGQISWDELGQVVVHDGKLEIFTLKRPDSAAAVYETRRIPNLDVFAGLIKPYLVIKGA